MLIRWVRLLVLSVALVGFALAVTTTADASSDPHGGASGAPSGVNPLDSWRGNLAIWTGVIFVGLLAVLSKFAWHPIADGLQKRERGIADEIASAERRNEEAKELLVAYEAKLEGAKGQIDQMLVAGRRDAEKVGQEVMAKARADADVERQRAITEIQLASAAAKKTLVEESADLAVLLAGKIVGERVDRAAHGRLIQKTIDQFSQSES